MGYRYETHLHTVQGSLCGKSTGAEHARFYKEKGYQGIVITDHFLGGNTAMPRTGEWKDRVDAFVKGYEDALAEGRKIGLDVFFGWEECFNRDGEGCDEYLIYGLDKQWLYEHPEIENCTRKHYYEAVRAGGGCMVQAHPFRMRGYIKNIRLGLQFSDGIEAANRGNDQWSDVCAIRYAKEYGFPMIAGSDNHHSTADTQVYGIELEKPLRDIRDLVGIILNKEPIGLVVPEERFVQDPDHSPSHEIFWLDENENNVPTHRDWMHE